MTAAAADTLDDTGLALQTGGWGDRQQAAAFESTRDIKAIVASPAVYAVGFAERMAPPSVSIAVFWLSTASIAVALSLKLTGSPFNTQAYIGLVTLTASS